MIALTSGDMDKSRGERTKIRYGLTESQGILISLRTTKAGYAENKEALSRKKKKASAYFAWTANWKLTPDFFFYPSPSFCFRIPKRAVWVEHSFAFHHARHFEPNLGRNSSNRSQRPKTWTECLGSKTNFFPTEFLFHFFPWTLCSSGHVLLWAKRRLNGGCEGSVGDDRLQVPCLEIRRKIAQARLGICWKGESHGREVAVLNPPPK